MKAFVKFGRETSKTKSSPMQNSKLDKKWACFQFFGLFCFKALTANAEKTCKKHCLEVVSIKCQR